MTSLNAAEKRYTHKPGAHRLRLGATPAKAGFLRIQLLVTSLVLILLAPLQSAEGEGEARVERLQGRPMIVIDGVPTALPVYSPVGWDKAHREAAIPGFAQHQMGAYFLAWSNVNRIDDLDDQAAFILARDPKARFFIRNCPAESAEWRAGHQDQLFVDETGAVLPVPSLASQAGWEEQARTSTEVVQACEGRPWSNRIIGYWNGLRVEGTHEPLLKHMLFDHSGVMRSALRDFLRRKYGSVAALRAAYGRPALTFDTVEVPLDQLRGSVPEVSQLLYWQPAAANQPLRDYLELNGELFRAGFARMTESNASATPHKRLFFYDAFKQSMLGWSNFGFFNPSYSRPLSYAELMAGSGHLGVAECLSRTSGFDGVVTPNDYQVRGVGGICEPEGMVDSAILRGKYFLCEYDIRTYANPSEQTSYGYAADLQEFSAVNWRNMATALTRGYNGYWMDLCGSKEGWYGAPEIQAVIGRSVEVIRESLNWEHADVPAIAVIVDDSAVLETNGDGRYFNEALMWELKTGLSRCGLPYRLYLFEDLALDNFPEHRLFYFPNLFRVTDERLALLQRKVFGNGRVVVFGPGSGISDGQTLSPLHAKKLTGFDFHYLPVNHERRVHIQNFDHPVTAGLRADVIYGSTLSYGPLLYPASGISLGMGWTKQGRGWSGLSLLEMGQGATGRETPSAARGPGDWASVFTTAVPLPAELWRNLARYAGAHIYNEDGDIVLASRRVVALHSIRSGTKTLALPGRFTVTDLITGERVERSASRFRFHLEAPGTRVFRLDPR